MKIKRDMNETYDCDDVTNLVGPFCFRESRGLGPERAPVGTLLFHSAGRRSATLRWPASDKAGFEDFDLAPRTERLAKDLEVSLTRNEEVGPFRGRLTEPL